MPDKRHLLAKRKPLLDAMFSRGLTALEEGELHAIEQRLEEIETAESDEFDRGYPESRAGKLEAALDRLEESVRATRGTPHKAD